MDWVPALRAAEPRLEILGWHPREAPDVDRTWLAEAEGLFAWKIPTGFLDLMPRLAWIQNSGAGVDHLMSNPEVPLHVPITRADGRFGFWMARYVVAHLLAQAQRLDGVRAAQGEGHWAAKLLPEDLFGRKAVVVGFGRIGRQIARALRELGLSVVGVVSAPREDDEFPLLGPADLPDLVREARCLVLCCPLTPGTRGLVGPDLLAQGHDRLMLVNVGRGELVDTVALLDALDAGRLAHAVLDVFEVEPLPAESPLWRHPKVTVTPHHSGPSTPADLIPDILHNLRAFAEGRPITGAVDRTKGY